MDDTWAVAIGAVAVGLMAGLAGAGLLHRALTSGRRDDPVYRDSALHLGHNVPTIKRATLHGHLDNAETFQFFVDHFHDRPRPA